MKAQMSLPDMKLPISYAFGYPKRIKSDQARFQFIDYPNLTFEEPDIKNFRNLAIAYKALEQEGNSPCVMNAANEIAVESFLHGQVGFLKMSDIIEKTLETVEFISDPDFEDFIVSDREARRIANQLIGEHRV